MSDSERVLCGITFSTSEEYLQAQKELDGIHYINENNDMNNEQTVLALYNKFVHKDVFHTQIGYEFLKSLQERLVRSEEIDNSQIAKLPIRDFSDSTDKDAVHIVPDKHEDSFRIKDNQQKVIVVEDSSKRMNTKTSSMNEQAQSKTKRKKPAMYLEAERSVKRKSELEIVKGKYRWAVFLNVVMVIAIIFMVYITLNGNRVNILNYETKLQDKYAAWEEDLLAREEELNKLRNEINSALGD